MALSASLKRRIGKIDTEVLVDQLVPHPGNPLPGEIRVRVLHRPCHVLRGFTQDFEVPDDRILRLVISEEGLASTGRVRQNPVYGVTHVHQVDPVLLHSG